MRLNIPITFLAGMLTFSPSFGDQYTYECPKAKDIAFYCDPTGKNCQWIGEITGVNGVQFLGQGDDKPTDPARADGEQPDDKSIILQCNYPSGFISCKLNFTQTGNKGCMLAGDKFFCAFKWTPSITCQ